MFGTNYSLLVGTLGRAPDYADFENGSEVCNFTLATTDSITKETVWHKIVAKGALAGICKNQNLGKGSVVTVVGHISYRKFTDSNTGQERQVTEIIAHRLDFLPGHGENAQNQYNEFQGGFNGQQQVRSPYKNRGPQHSNRGGGYQNRGSGQQNGGGFAQHNGGSFGQQNSGSFGRFNTGDYQGQPHYQENGFGNNQGSHSRQQKWQNDHAENERAFHQNQQD